MESAPGDDQNIMMPPESATGDDQQVVMLPPPPRTFKDREELIAFVRSFGANHGYVVNIRKSKKDSRVILGCDRGGAPRRRASGELKRKRKASSRFINCPFEVVGRKDDDVWEIQIKNGEHNHEPLKDMSEHRYSRRFSEEEARQVKELIEAGLKPAQVLETLKQSNPQLQSTRRHLYNLKAKFRQGNFPEGSFKSWRPNACDTGASSQLKVSNFIGGKFVESQGSIFSDVIDPATQEVISQVPSATYEEFKAAVVAAKEAFPSWKNAPISTRQRIMIKMQQLIRRDIENLALIISSEQGKTIKSARAGILHGLEVVEHACGGAALETGEFVSNASSGIDMFAVREPLGVCAGICQFNYPAIVALWMFPISITCGNTFVLKPSQKSPGASMKLAELAMEAGLPDGVLNIVHGGNDLVDYLCYDDDIKAISVTGSYTADMHIYAKAAASGKHVEANIQSNNLAVVMPDASMDTTLDALVGAAFGAAEDPFISLSSVIFVGYAGPWEEEIVKRARALKVNGGTDKRADMGPVFSKEVKDMICSLVHSAVEGGADLILDGRNIMVPGYENGNFVGPTILSGITTNMECYKDDYFAPVLLCTEVHSLEEAIAIVNQQKTRNGASIFTTSGIAARKFQNAVEAGLVGINVPVPVPLPFSSTGSMASFAGILNFYGKAGIQFYTQVKMVAQQWRGLTTKRISSSISSERVLPHQSVPLTMLTSSDLSNCDTLSSASATSDEDITDQERPVDMPPESAPASYGTSMGIQSTSVGASLGLTQAPDINLCLPQAFNWIEGRPSTSQVMEGISQCPDRNWVPSNAPTNNNMAEGNSAIAPPASESCYTHFPAQQDDRSEAILSTNDNGVPSDHGGAYVPLPQNTDGTLQRTGAILHSATEQVYMPILSDRNMDAGALAQRIGSFTDPSSDGSYMSATQGHFGIAMQSNEEGVYMPIVSEGNKNVIPFLTIAEAEKYITISKD